MSDYAYVLNSADSNVAIDLEVTHWTCGGNHNGVYTVCAYADNVPPLTYVKFPIKSLGDNGLHVQAHPDSSPTGAYELTSCMITLNTATGSIAVAPWSGPNAALAAGAKAPTQAEITQTAAPRQRRPQAHELPR